MRKTRLWLGLLGTIMLVITPTALAQCPGPCEGDLNGDGCVDLSDLAALLARYGVCCDQAWQPDEHTVALWYLNGNGDDFSGNGNHLTVKTDQVGWVDDAPHCRGVMMGEDGYPGDCFESDGGALTAPGEGCTYPGSGDWTVEAWVYFPTNTESHGIVYHYSEHVSGHEPYYLSIVNGIAEFQINNVTVASADVSAYVKQWFHLAAVYRYEEDVALYVNDSEVARQSTSLVPEYLPDYDVYLGGNYCGTNIGLKIDEVRISNVARYPWRIAAWGLNEYGQCDVPEPNTDFIAVDGANCHGLALKSDGSLEAWGCNSNGQIDVPLGNNYVSIATFGEHNVVLKADGSLDAWGRNIYGACDFPSGNDYAAVAAGDYWSMALKSDGSIVAWGAGDGSGHPHHGQHLVPTGNDFTAIAAGCYHGVAIRADRSLVGWGRDDYGQATVPSGNDFVAISCGVWHCLALRADGSLVAWGICDGSADDYGQVTDTPDGNDFVAIDAGGYHNLALRADGSIAAWGNNEHGQCDPLAGDDYVAVGGGAYFSLALQPN